MTGPTVPRLAALALIALAACGGEATGPDRIERLPRDLSATERDLVRASNAFGLELFRRTHAVEEAPNVFLSPLSASMALGMTLNGAAGETWAGMRHALAFGDLDQEEINASYASLLELLTGLDPRVDIAIGNSIWADLGFPVLPTFQQVVREHFDAEARELDFRDPASLETINGWVEQATRGRIERILEEISPADLMFLINATWFSGDWTKQFDPAKTQRAPFQRADGSTVDVQMMTQKLELPVRFTERWVAGELAYGGGAFGMVIVVPQGETSLGDVVSELDDDGWAALVASFDTTELDVFLPRFTIEYDTYLNEPLAAMGMARAFSGEADFSRLTPERVCIQFVRQKTFVEVDEEGTEAAAVTVVGIGRTSAPPALRADRPFLFAIRERLTGTLLFIGAIGDPAAREAPEVEKPPPGC